MARRSEPPIVAHLGRPETAEETAARKAENTRNYRGSQTFRNLIVALVASLALVLVIVWAVPRGEAPEREAIDVAAIAQGVESSYGRDVVVPDVPDAWTVNLARVEADEVPTWRITYAPDETGFVILAQGFDADTTWAAQTLGGAAPTGSVEIDGVEWDVYEISKPAENANVSYALGTQAGADHVLIYGATTPETAGDVAARASEQIRGLAVADEGKQE